MASDDYGTDFSWDDDPFGGDLDFDMDFDMDPFKGKGFIQSFGKGFLSGVGHELGGNANNRFRTLRTILPSSFSNALDKATFVHDRMSDIVDEFKRENAESAKSLQTIAATLSNKMGDKLPGFIKGGLDNYSAKDFSSWEELDYGSNGFNSKIERTEDSDIERAMDDSISSQSAMFSSLGDSLNSMTAAATASLQSTIGAGNRQLVNIEGAMRDMLNYQRHVDAKIQQAQLNLMARSYVQDSKYFKFMEAGIHAQVKELKMITKYVGMSDFEKTSMLTATRQFARNKVFSTVGKRVGGLTGLLRDKFGGENRRAGYGAMGQLLGAISDGIEMSDGNLSRGMIGDILGKLVAEKAVDQLPAFFQRGPGKKVVDKLLKQYPEQGKYIKEQVKKITDIGNVVSYASTSGVGMLNYMAENYQPLDEMKYMDYDDYVSQLPPGKKPMKKAAWTALNAASNRGKESLNKMMAEVTKTRGTQYVLKRRNVKDLNQPGIWKEMNNITLNEVLPGLISKTNQLLEQMRTGKDNVEAVSYNYTRGQFQTDSQKRVSVAADLMPHGEFQRYAQASLSLVDSIDPDKTLSASTRKAFAQQVAKDIDAEMGFNPYYYLGDIKGMSPSAQTEVHAALKRYFGISNEDVHQFNSADSLGKMKKMSTMTTAEGRERLNNVSASAANLKENFPNVAERIDLLRSTGNEQMLRDLGVIYTQNGIDRIDMQKFHDRIGMYMDDPNNPILRDAAGNNSGPKPKPLPTKGGLRISPQAGGSPEPQVDHNEALGQLNSTLGTLNERLGAMAPITPSSANASNVNFDSITGDITDIKGTNQGILDKMGEVGTLLSTLTDLAKEGRLTTGAPGSPSEERKQEEGKKSFLSRLKKLPSLNGLGSGFDYLTGNPALLGGLLSGLGAMGLGKSPLVSLGIASAGMIAGAAYDFWLGKRDGGRGGPKPTGETPSDDEDIMDEQGEPFLKSAKLKAGQYIDAATKAVIKTWGDIRGPIYDTTSKVVIGAKDLAGKIFGADGRAVALKGLRHVRDKAIAGYNLLNPVERIKSVIASGKEMVYQQDVYLKSNLKEPVLRASKFKEGDYYVRDESGNFKPIHGWNEINGAVYDDQGNQLVSEEEYKSGLVTSSGAVVRNMGAGAASMVGAVAGMGKSGLNALMGKFGFSKATPGAAPGSASSVSGAGSQSGVEKRLDKIYRMLATHFNLPMESEPGSDEDTGKGGSTGGVSSGLRLNSLAWKNQEKEKEEKHKVNEAIIKIAENTKGLGHGDEKDGEKKGFWGTIKGLLGGLGGFATKLIKNPIGTIGGLIFGSLLKSTARLAKIGTALFSGVLGIGSPVMKMLKWGFGKVAAAFLGNKAAKFMDGGADAIDDVPQRGQGARRRNRAGTRGRPRARGRFGGMLKGGAAAMAGSMALDYLSDNEPEDFENGTEDLSVGERDPATGRYKTAMDSVMDTATSWIPQGQLADSLIKGVAGPEGYKELDDKGLFWTSDGQFFFSRKKRDDAQAALEGKPVIKSDVGTTKSNTEITTQKKIRMAMYGIPNVNSNLARRVMGLENDLYKWVAIRDNRAELKPDTPLGQIIDNFANSGISRYADKSAISTWFMSRFRPIFLTYNAVAAVARMGDIVEFDNKKGYEVVQVVERVQQAISNLNPPPYSIDMRIDDKEGTLDPEGTRKLVAELFAKLKKEYPAPSGDVETIAADTETDLKKDATKTKGDSPTSLPGMASQSALGKQAADASAQAAESGMSTPGDITTINISDLMPGKDQPMDPFVMVRLAAYGNIDNMPWRVAAVLRLERYMENFITIMGKDAKFTGKTNQIMELFKASFRLNNDVSRNNWARWFRDRFLPIMMEYCKQLHELRGGTPEGTWKTVSATSRAIIARKLTELIVTVDDKQVPIWEVVASPFPDSKSGQWPDRANKYLAILDAKAQEARLKDPEMEDEKTKASKEATTANAAAMTQANAAKIMESVYSKGATGVSRDGSSASYGGGNASATQAGGYYPNATMSAPGGGAGSAGAFMGNADAKFNPEFIKQAGEDKGIKMTLEQGEKLMLSHLVKAGIRDNKTLALALAMAKKETGGYQSTVENTNWSAPTLLKYFKNIPDAATAQKVAAMSPAERAMYVYGRAPKGPALGNQKPEDGWTYRGRGLFQLTGKANYEAFKKASGIDVVSNPKLVSEDPNVMAESAVWFLKNNKAMKSIAETGDFDTAVRGINGGNAVPATDERRQYYNDYLNKLRNGDLSIGGDDSSAGDDASAAQGTEAALNNQAAPVPEAADKNVPASKATNPTAPTPSTSNDVNELLKGQSSPPSNAGNTSTANASTMPQTAAATADASVASSSAPDSSSASSSSSDSSSTPTLAPTPSAPAPVNNPGPAKPSTASTPEKSAPASNDPNGQDMASVLAQIGAANGTTLKEILQVLKDANKQGMPSVKM